MVDNLAARGKNRRHHLVVLVLLAVLSGLSRRSVRYGLGRFGREFDNPARGKPERAEPGDRQCASGQQSASSASARYLAVPAAGTEIARHCGRNGGSQNVSGRRSLVFCRPSFFAEQQDRRYCLAWINPRHVDDSPRAPGRGAYVGCRTHSQRVPVARQCARCR
jgi:hypothetical protein